MTKKPTLTRKILLLLFNISIFQLIALLFWWICEIDAFVHFLVGAFVVSIIQMNSKKKTS